MNIYDSINYCSDIDDYRPIQSTLLTRFTTTDCSELWRTTNQDYGAFYYRQIPQYCIPDNLKSKNHRRYNHFQDWLSYQNLTSSFTKNSTNTNNNNQTIFPSNRNETVRITHRKKFLSTCNNNQLDRNIFSPSGEAGLITEYIVKKIFNKLQYLINPDEYHDVLQCAQILVSEILIEEPSLCINEIIDRVITIMITPPDNIKQSISNPCYSNVLTESTPCPSPQPLHKPNINNTELPLSTTVSTAGPFINCNQNIFEKLTNLENAISKISNHFIKS